MGEKLTKYELAELKKQQDKLETQQTINFNRMLATLPIIDLKDIGSVKKRINDYFDYCETRQQKPSITSYALALGVNKETVLNIVKGKTHLDTKEAELIVRGYTLLDAMMESFVLDGKVNVVAGIFLLKNHYGYKDQKDIEITHKEGEDLSPEELRKRYLENYVDVQGEEIN